MKIIHNLFDISKLDYKLQLNLFRYYGWQNNDAVFQVVQNTQFLIGRHWQLTESATLSSSMRIKQASVTCDSQAVNQSDELEATVCHHVNDLVHGQISKSRIQNFLHKDEEDDCIRIENGIIE